MMPFTYREEKSRKSYIQVMLPAIPDKRLQLLFLIVRINSTHLKMPGWFHLAVDLACLADSTVEMNGGLKWLLKSGYTLQYDANKLCNTLV